MNYRYSLDREEWDDELPTWRQEVLRLLKDSAQRKAIYGVIKKVVEDTVGLAYTGQYWTAGKGTVHFHRYDSTDVLDIVLDRRKKEEKKSS